MPDLRIAHVRKRYRLQPSAADDVSRLDRVFASAIGDELLDAALERAGIPASDEICIRRVDSGVQLDRSDSDLRLAAAWSIALADAVASRLREGGPDVVRYPSRFAALVDMVCAAARGDLERTWAWQSLGIWQAGDAVDVATARAEAIARLTRDASVAPAVLAAVARRGVLPLLVSGVSGAPWSQLARAALASFASGGTPIEQWLGDGPIEQEALDGLASPACAAAIARIERTSAIVRHLVSASVVRAADEPATVRALAILAVLECEPAAAAAPHACAIADGLARTLGSPVVEPAVPRSPGKPGRAEPPRPASPPRDAQDHDAVPDRGAQDTRVSGITAFGGLLFLLHLVRAVDLPSSLLREPALSARSLSWTLYRIALLLLPDGDSDPAALAFAGLPPQPPAPVLTESASTDAEDAALREARAAIISALRVRMAAAKEENDRVLLRRVTGRRAEVVADPAWIELRFAATDVCTDVRRAGLDLDPGWLPWLGIVVRFVYA